MKIIGHRGAKGLAPENTLPSFGKAMNYDVDELELDLRVTKDKVVVLHHDSHLTDPDGTKKEIAGSTYKQLVKHKKDLATFKELLDFVNKKTTLYLEIKPEVETGPIVKIIKEYLKKGWPPSNFMIASFSQPILLEMHKQLPGIEKIVLENWSSMRARRRAQQVDTKHISMNQRWLWGGFISAMALGGWKLYAYTLNDPKKARKWKKKGLYGTITDFPDLFKK